MNLPNDVARCDGVLRYQYKDWWKEQCVECHRRIAQMTDRRGITVSYMNPPEFIDNKCPSRIGQTDKGE